jgi:hypothetical protein
MLSHLKRLATSLLPLCMIAWSNVTSINSNQTFKMTKESAIGMLQYLPEDYHNNSDKYPLVIFLHGIIEKGVTSRDPAVIESAIHPVDNLGPPKYAKEGHQFPFILISPQLKYEHETWPGWYVLEVVNWAKEHLRVDEKRIHITGLSLGGGGVFTAIEDNPGVFASAAPVSANSNLASKPCIVAKGGVAVWAFHGLNDPDISFRVTEERINSINECAGADTSDPPARITVYDDLKHNVWDRAYRTDQTFHRQNLYDWMMRVYNTQNSGNYLPTVDAGRDQSLTKDFSTRLSGTATDRDGEISSYRWTKQSGPEVSITDPTSRTTDVTFFRKGLYTFKFTAKDENGDSDSDFVKIEVN